MRKLRFMMNISLDGYIEDSRGSLDWSVPSEQVHQHFNDLEKEASLFLYGRGLYENMSAYWPTADEDPSAPPVVIEYARMWRAKPKIVFSNTLKDVSWNATLFKGDIREEVEKLKAQPGGDITVGGAGLAASLMRLGLIDEYRTYMVPVILGGGKRMFPALEMPVRLNLLETHTFDNGVVMLMYEKG